MEYVLGDPVTEQNGGALVRLADDARKCVVYIGHRDVGTEDQLTPIGTGFFVHTGEPGGSYLVTARHIAHDVSEVPFDLRMNQKDGSGKLDPIDQAKWHFHPTDENVDIAVMEYDPPEWADFKHFPCRLFLSEVKLQSKNIGPGDRAYVVGVFHLLHGTRKNLPFVHNGNISLFPDDEPIPVRDWRDPQKKRTINVNGYLVEAQTLPGSSGSPVFVRRSLRTTSTENGVKIKAWMYGTVWLLGLWQGAWMGRPGHELVVPEGEDIVVPAGVGVVVPAKGILEVINQPKLKERRDAVKHSKDSRRAVSLQKASPTNTDSPLGKEAFNSLLGAAVRPQKRGGKT